MSGGPTIDVLAFDPSSTCVGWARSRTLLGPDQTSPVRWGRIKAKGENEFERLADLRAVVSGLVALELAEGGVGMVVVEAAGARRPSQAGNANAHALSVHGMAVGVVLGVLWAAGVAVTPVEASRWTRFGRRGGMRKADRLAMLPRMDVGATYDAKRDAGGDGGDALMLSWWGARFGSDEPRVGGGTAVGSAVGWCPNVAERARIVRAMVGPEWSVASGAARNRAQPSAVSTSGGVW